MTSLNRPRNEFLKRLSMYLIGIGIGFMLLSIFHRMRQVSAPQPGTPVSAPQAQPGPSTPGTVPASTPEAASSPVAQPSPQESAPPGD